MGRHTHIERKHMRQYENKKNISLMEFTVPVTAFCPLGPNYYRATAECSVELTDRIVDFLDLEDYFKKELNGKHLTTEDLCDEIHSTLMREYNTEHVVVTISSDSHFPIRTTKAS